MEYFKVRRTARPNARNVSGKSGKQGVDKIFQGRGFY